MIPGRFVHLQEIPLTRNGKVDLRALPEPDISDTGAGYLAPRDTIEERLVRLWADVLKIESESIGIDSDFFQIGGHSLRATILISKIHKAFDTRIPLQEIFKTPTVRGISEYIKNNRENKDGFVFIKPVEKRDYYPLSSAQHRLYVTQQMDVNTTNYNSLVPVLLEGDPDLARLEDVFWALSRRHESLRASFEIIDGEPKQKISREVPFTLEQYRLKEEKTVEFVRETFIKPFDLNKAPLFRVGLVKVAEKRHILVVSLHNIIADGTSMGILMKEFMHLYEGEKLPLLRLSYAAYSQWQNSKEQKELVNKQEQYWLKQFEKKAPKLNLPTDFPRPALRSFEGSSTQFRIDKETTREIKKLISKENVTLYMFLLAVLNVFLSKITGQEDILVGTPVANRRHADLQPIVGMFVNILVMRNFPRKNQSFRSLLGDVKKRTSEAFDNQDYKLEDLMDRVVEEKDLSRNSLFDVSFSLQNMDIPVIDISSLRMSPIDYTLRSSRFDLVFVAHELENEDGAEINVLVEYCTKLFRQETIQMFIKNFKEVIVSVLENKDVLPQDIEISSGDVVSAVANIQQLEQLDLGF
jgi:acyl carrier protein